MTFTGSNPRKNTCFEDLTSVSQGWRWLGCRHFEFQYICCLSLLGKLTRIPFSFLFYYFIILVCLWITKGRSAQWLRGLTPHDSKVRGSTLSVCIGSIFISLSLFYLFFTPFIFHFIWFFYHLFLFYWKYFQHKLMLFLSLLFCHALFYFIWVIYDGLMRSWTLVGN